MPNSIVTKTGDGGTTGLFGGTRVSKDHPRIEAYGTVDELNAVLGVALTNPDLPPTIAEQLTAIQHLLFRVGGDLATPMPQESKQDRVDAKHVAQVEEWIVQIEAHLAPQTSFILPGGTASAAQLHLARTVCRRAERAIVALQQKEPVNLQVPVLLNRLSDYFFVAARKANRAAGRGDAEVRY